MLEERLQKRQINQEHSIKSKAKGGGPCKKPDCGPGDIVYVKNDGSKHEARSPFIVTGEGNREEEVSIRKVLHSQGADGRCPVFSKETQVVDKKFLFMRDDKDETYNNHGQDEYS